MRVIIDESRYLTPPHHVVERGFCVSGGVAPASRNALLVIPIIQKSISIFYEMHPVSRRVDKVRKIEGLTSAGLINPGF